MELETMIPEFRAWLAARDINDVEIKENIGAEENMTAITFPIEVLVLLPVTLALPLSTMSFISSRSLDLSCLYILLVFRLVRDFSRLSRKEVLL